MEDSSQSKGKKKIYIAVADLWGVQVPRTFATKQEMENYWNSFPWWATAVQGQFNPDKGKFKVTGVYKPVGSNLPYAKDHVDTIQRSLEKMVKKQTEFPPKNNV